MIATKHTQSLSDFRQKAGETLERLNRTGDAEILTVNGAARAVLLSPAAYDELARKALVARDAALRGRGVRHINERDTAAQFAALADEWRRGRSPSSTVERLAAHPAYREIIKMGTKAIPYLLRELEQRPAQWFWALREITKQDPVPTEDRGNLRRSAAAWLNWGKENGYEW